MTSLDLESNSRPGKNVERQTDEFLSEIVQRDKAALAQAFCSTMRKLRVSCS
ncbi:hypothetical protein [Methylomonas sp. MgM2]